MYLVKRRSTLPSVPFIQRPRLKRGQKVVGSSSLTANRTAAGTKEEEEEEEGGEEGEEEEEGEGIPVVYIRLDTVKNGRIGRGFEWFCLKHNDYLSSKPPICECGAIEDLKSPFFCQPDKFRPQSSYAAVGHLIYVFGGLDIENNRVESAEVSYIDTCNPRDGWKVCKNQMSKARTVSYPITLDDGRVLLLGGFRVQDQPFAQMFNPKDDKWIALENYPKTAPYSLHLLGHMIVKEKEETMVLMHDFNAPYLYTYNVSTDSWGTRWKDEFKTHYNSGALVNGIYYVVDVVSGPERIVLCGYKVSSQQAVCLQVEILLEKDGKNWLPWPNRNGRMPYPKLFACGDNKLGMIWYHCCFQDESVTRLSYYWSIFEMKKEESNDGVLRLSAHPLSNVCYHVYGNTGLIDRVVPVATTHQSSILNHRLAATTNSLENLAGLQRSSSPPLSLSLTLNCRRGGASSIAELRWRCNLTSLSLLLASRRWLNQIWGRRPKYTMSPQFLKKFANQSIQLKI